MTQMTRIYTDFYGLNLDFCDAPDFLDGHEFSMVLMYHGNHINQKNHSSDNP